MTKITTIIFDLGGVLIDWNPANVYMEAFHGDKAKTDWFLNTICTSTWNEQQDAGQSLEEGTLEKIREFPEHEDLIRLYYDEWEKMLSGEISGTVRILKRLKESENYHLYAITNWSAETFPLARKKFEFLQWFEDIIVSGEVKMIKPSEGIYRHAIEKHRLNPSECVFIDDNPGNIKTAAALGFKVIEFKGTEELERGLKALGIVF